MTLDADAVDGRLYRAVDELDREHDEHRADEQRALDSAPAQPEAEGHDDQCEQALLAERLLLAPGGRNSAPGTAERARQAHGPRGPLVGTERHAAAGFQATSSWRAARTSSSRRTGSVCGADLTAAASVSASRRIAASAAT